MSAADESAGSDSDRLYLQACIELAEQGRHTCAPNPTVGCIIVRHGVVLGRGWHQYAGQGHAEVNAIADAGGDVRGATVYVSLEPCSFEGRTPACAATLVEEGVGRVVVAALDPHPQVAGEGLRMLQRAGIEVDVVALPEALELIAGYILRITQKRPLVRIKTASSLDGATALADGRSQWITGAAARSDVQRLRARSDAIITGVGTVLADDPALTVRDEQLAPFRQPLRVVLDRRLRTPPDCKLISDGHPTLVVHEDTARAGPEWETAPGVMLLALADVAPGAVLEHLAEMGCNEVLVEAGPTVVGSFVSHAAWDLWVAYLAPKLLGTQTRPVADFVIADLQSAPRGRTLDVTPVGDDIRITLEPSGE
ncbi:MAG: bifunctional diaminohydroxyphosphoribosylaminopyrimidine deaminase/5-amino-6-(5-phosphoribosylamino)uracil reductase RibD [Pseudomonadota bacterium]